MKVKELKEWLKDKDDDVDVVVSGSDHSFIPVNYPAWTFAEYHRTGQYFEYYTDEHMDEGSKKIPVIILNR